jgi:hypothetical protein
MITLEPEVLEEARKELRFYPLSRYVEDLVREDLERRSGR